MLTGEKSPDQKMWTYTCKEEEEKMNKLKLAERRKQWSEKKLEAKINKTKIWFFTKIDKIDKCLAGLTSEKIQDPNEETQKQLKGHYYQV